MALAKLVTRLAKVAIVDCSAAVARAACHHAAMSLPMMVVRFWEKYYKPLLMPFLKLRTWLIFFAAFMFTLWSNLLPPPPPPPTTAMEPIGALDLDSFGELVPPLLGAALFFALLHALVLATLPILLGKSVMKLVTATDGGAKGERKEQSPAGGASKAGVGANAGGASKAEVLTVREKKHKTVLDIVSTFFSVAVFIAYVQVLRDPVRPVAILQPS